MRRYCDLLALRRVIIFVQYIHVHVNGGLEFAIRGRDGERIGGVGLTVQRLFGYQAPLTLVTMDHGKLAQGVPICGQKHRNLLDNENNNHNK